MNIPELQQKTFLLILIAVSLAFGWILLPFYGAVFWGSVLAIIFAPFYRRLLAVMDQRRNLAALTTLLLCLIIVILPLTLIMASLLKEGLAVYQRIRSGELNFGAYFQQIMDARPPWMVSLMERSGIGNLSELRDALSNSALQGSQLIATQALISGRTHSSLSSASP